MSATTYITSIPVFHGVQGKFYIVDGCKYHTRFPIEWALDHKNWITGKRREIKETSGPKGCGNCIHYGSIRGVFVGYCGTCLHHYEIIQHWRGKSKGGGDINELSEGTIEAMYPYMTGVKKSEIGDEEDPKEDDEYSSCVYHHE